MADYNDFYASLDHGLKAIGKDNVSLNVKQFEVLKTIVIDKKDVLAVLPTGYGKSLTYQVLPEVFDCYDSVGNSPQYKSIVLVISPLNALIRDQVSKLKDCGMKVCVLRGDRVIEGDNDESKSLENLANYQLILAHPEAVMDHKEVLKLLKSKKFIPRVKAIVVDEAHLAIEWQKFRPAYSKLGILGSYFPNVPIVGLTATATIQARKEIAESLGLLDPVIIDANPDRSNIYFAALRRPDRGDGKLDNILDPLVEELIDKRLECPLTLIFGTLETISSCYVYFHEKMGDRQYEPLGSEKKSCNRMFNLI